MYVFLVTALVLFQAVNLGQRPLVIVHAANTGTGNTVTSTASTATTQTAVVAANSKRMTKQSPILVQSPSEQLLPIFDEVPKMQPLSGGVEQPHPHLEHKVQILPPVMRRKKPIITSHSGLSKKSDDSADDANLATSLPTIEEAETSFPTTTTIETMFRTGPHISMFPDTAALFAGDQEDNLQLGQQQQHTSAAMSKRMNMMMMNMMSNKKHSKQKKKKRNKKDRLMKNITGMQDKDSTQMKRSKKKTKQTMARMRNLIATATTSTSMISAGTTTTASVSASAQHYSVEHEVLTMTTPALSLFGLGIYNHNHRSNTLDDVAVE